MSTTTLQRHILPVLDFILGEWLDLEAVIADPPFAGHTVSDCRDLLFAASEVAAEAFEPAQRISDASEPYIDSGGEVVLPEATHRAWEAYKRLGVLSAAHDPEWGGIGLPRVVEMAAQSIFAAAGASLIPAMLTKAAASLVLEHGADRQKDVFARALLEGRWSGTMAMSESEAGSSLSDITTRATADGNTFSDDPLGPRYRLRGAKMWISGAEHRLNENIIHLVLAKIPGPDGTVDRSTRGISLFIVPKFVVSPVGEMVERNDVSLVGLNHKLGNRGIPNTALAFGAGEHEPDGRPGAIGHLIGAPGDGLRQMFHMMNAARTEIGLAAAALGLAGYVASLDYARHRRQGRPASASGKDVAHPQVPIIDHPDVRRMLLAQKSYSEGGIALALYCARLLDTQRTASSAESDAASDLLDLLTPIVKSWPSEWCLEGNSLAIQVMGGAGYTRDHLVEQYWRDQRLNMIHEGTHGIQAIDLLGRKVRLRDGALLGRLGDLVSATCEHASLLGFREESGYLRHHWAEVIKATESAWSTSDPQDALTNATPFMQGFGHVVMAWIHLDMSVVAVGSKHPQAGGRLASMRYFFAYELPKVDAWLGVVSRRETICRDITDKDF